MKNKQSTSPKSTSETRKILKKNRKIMKRNKDTPDEPKPEDTLNTDNTFPTEVSIPKDPTDNTIKTNSPSPPSTAYQELSTPIDNSLEPDPDVLKNCKPFETVSTKKEPQPSETIIKDQSTEHPLSTQNNINQTKINNHNMQKFNNTINFKKLQQNKDTIDVNICQVTNVVNIDTNLTEDNSVQNKIEEKSVNSRNSVYNVNYIDLTKSNKVDMTLLSKKEMMNKELPKMQEDIVKRNTNAMERKKMYKLYQENASLSGFESSVDIRYVVKEKEKVEGNFIKNFFMKLFGKEN